MKIQVQSIYKFLLLIMISLVISACQSKRINGQFINNDQIQEIEGKRLSKEQVINIIGSPTIIPDYSPNNWYYIQRTVSQRAWFEPKVLEQKITEVSFDQKGFVNKVNVYENMNLEEISSAKEFTKTQGTEQTGIQKFIKNIGRFTKKS